ncbi:N-acetyllactosaminide alpha-1,3-galactosyltransferase-like [Sphaeramia orbicularis]|uniref:N-acetyllactosaminide alpha-1,3-galactosyltransferase-like n=1 Tax=Sphaeramia orbicularis TaxID=375764 RepID=A0A672Y3N5_9TELE|nr:N-acetyllactosaminide alpha-1,3-galactosyltransferase-like [Sphaeramia orbicularis]
MRAQLMFNAKGFGQFGFFAFALVFTSFVSLYLYQIKTFAPVNQRSFGRRVFTPNISTDGTLKYGARSDVKTSTPWKAPIIWEGMFNPELYDEEHKKHMSSVALTVFAVGKYLDAYLHNFLVSAEVHFMSGLPVTYYIFTDLPESVPKMKLGPRRNLKVIKVEKYSRWQDISMMRMKFISELIDTEISYHFPYVYCLDVDQVFKARFGSEALGESVAMLHSYFYDRPESAFTYDKNPKSKAYMTTGDFYYHAAVFGGSWQNVKALVDECYLGIMEDKLNGVEALWHDESHLNKFFWVNKPTRLLSPEYCWDEKIGGRSEIKIMRLIWAEKHYDTLRT